MKNTIKNKLRFKVPSYNLQNILIAMVIIGIALLLFYPNSMPLITKAKTSEAKIHLRYIYDLQTTYRYMYSKYSMDLNEIDYEEEKTVHENGRSKYTYEILNASSNSFKVRATAVVDFDGDGVFNVWEIDESGLPKQITKD